MSVSAHHRASLADLLRLPQLRSWACADKEDFHNHTRFFEEAAAGTLPAFSWIMPPAPMMDHPCHDIALGERLHKDICVCPRTILSCRCVWSQALESSCRVAVFDFLVSGSQLRCGACR